MYACAMSSCKNGNTFQKKAIILHQLLIVKEQYLSAKIFFWETMNKEIHPQNSASFLRHLQDSSDSYFL